MSKGIGAFTSNSDSVSISTRKVENGYIVTESRSTGDDYSCREFFTETKPTLSASSGMGDYLGSADGPSGPRGLRPAMGELARKKRS